ncbi:lysozyme [Nostoc sp. CENA67]|uniref:Lysozyme n=1 Tax=Amazonocrinis nigriterrae CENA67 TaxID=2794033 RepID=A0A8J7L9M8_9NOST|nr:lysozyme [Amazonocrinis nigriterrae]MBH8561651.1 lysozyme [Amazonocrinis nigriterrae CENA67]
MTLPKPGLKLIKQFEGCILHAYPDPLTNAKPITIGWGSTKRLNGSDWNLGDKITQEEADQLLIIQLENHYLPPLQKIPSWEDLTQNQQGAILSFGYNLGANFYNRQGFGSISGLLKNPDRWYDHKYVTETFCLYRNPGTAVEAGLRRRRMAEANLWLTPVV